MHQKTSYFYQLNIEILKDKNLSHSEKLTMAVLNGLADEEGKSYPSNEWLEEILDVDARGIRRILESLEKNGYIERQIISCVSNPFKKYRIISILPQFKKCLREVKNDRIDEVKNDRTDGSKMTGIIYKKDIIDKKEEREEAPPPTPPPERKTNPKEIPFTYNRVTMKASDHQKLVDELGVDKTQEMLERLDEYADINPKRFKQYANHCTVIRKWIRDDKANGKTSKNDSKASNFLQKVKDVPGVCSRSDIVFGNGYIEFTRIRDAYFKVGEPSFEEKVKNTLRKMGIPVHSLE